MHWGTFTVLIIAQLLSMLTFAAVSGRLKILCANLFKIVEENNLTDQPILELKEMILDGIEKNFAQIRGNLSTTGLLFAMIIISIITYGFGVPAFPVPLWVGVGIALYLIIKIRQVLANHDQMLALGTNFNIMVFAHTLDEMSVDSEAELKLDGPSANSDTNLTDISKLDSNKLEL